MKLKELAKYRHITIQCHDIPDADAICSGFALQCYLRSFGADAGLIYGGTAKISKPSLLILLDMLNIEISHAEELPPETDLIITVDCQRGAGNVKNFDIPLGAAVVVIDHHRPEIPENENTIIRPHLASCATLVWDLLRKENFAMDNRIQTALYYGLFSDTNGLSEARHPLDRDLAEIQHDAGLIKKLKNSAITPDELDIISGALRKREIIENIGLFQAQPCDPNLLGFTSDIAQQSVGIDCCVVYCLQRHGIKLSVRSGAREIMASEIAGHICRGAGSGGGNIEKAGGYIGFKELAEISGGTAPEDYLKNRVKNYLDSYTLIYAGNNSVNFGAMPLYKKLPLPAGYAKSTDIFPEGSKITVRTLEGDIDTVADKDTYLMIGIQGEVYPILREKFENGYTVSDNKYLRKAEYIPTVLNRVTGERAEITPAAKSCIPREGKIVRAEMLAKDTKVFSYWDTERYFYGGKGDYLVANEGDYGDCYIVGRDIFAESYERL
ncbi:MAG: DHH family phosphoesterase [Syntrophomonadaceae bacterium]|jgi:phosphoglycolate phosphatase|nr:DHH family phosphoesterase [Syntrophomonadaceae bacterium]